MDVKRFQPGFPGRAFVPSPLPPAWTWPERLWPLLLDANRELARLDGIGAYLPDPELLLRPLQHREARTSSRLEGTYAKPAQILLLELDDGPSRETTDDANAREIFTFVDHGAPKNL